MPLLAGNVSPTPHVFASFKTKLISAQYCKQIVKSLMAAGDGWVRRLANNPEFELQVSLYVSANAHPCINE